MSAHTPGLLKLHAKYPQDIVTPDGHYTVARTLPQPTIAVAEANARRLVACWNAFDGVPTSTIESMGGVVRGACADLMTQRDELAQAVDRLLSWERHGHQTRAEDIAFAQQALTKAEGGAA